MAEIAIGIATELGVKALEEVLKHISTKVKKEISHFRSLDRNIESLRDKLRDVKELMLNAQAVVLITPHSSPLLNSKAFVKGLKKFVYDGEDIVDEFDLKVQRQPMNLKQRWKIARKLKKLFAEFEALAKENENAEKFLNVVKHHLSIPGDVKDEVGNGLKLARKPSINMIQRKDFEMVGRDKVKQSLLDDLSGNRSKPSVVLLTGMGGIGKTTLAHAILHHPRMVTHFPIREWVTVGDRNLDAKRVLNQMIHKPADLKEKRFLIVLDDVWKGKDFNLKNSWNELWAPLSYGSEGSRVIVTTREEDVRDSMEGSIKVKVEKIGILSDEECQNIFEAFAFPCESDMPSSSSAPPPPATHLREIGKQIVNKKVKGVPLAARVIGSSLRGKADKYWDAALKQIDPTAPEMKSVILWSYLNLSMHLKQCFVYCSLFPKDTSLDKTKIIQLWMAHSFIVEPRDGWMTLVDIGESYFQDLVHASLIEEVVDVDGRPLAYKMHDLIHDFAFKIFRDEFSDCEDSKIADPQTLRHLVIRKGQTLPENASDIKKLKVRTFLSEESFDVRKLRSVGLKTVRVLSVAKFPTELFKELSQVRYLDISDINISTLPESVCSLYALQTLILHEETIHFPKDMSKQLVNLHHIETAASSMSEYSRLGQLTNLPGKLTAAGSVSNISRLGQLTKLHSIGDRFILGKDNWHCVEELRNLEQLRGKLEIQGLGHVQYSQLVCREQLLANHGYLKELEFDMDGVTTPEVLNYLQPHGNLKALKIKNCGMEKLPSWLWNKGFNIVSLELSDCSVKKWPPLGCLPRLEKLRMENFSKLEQIDGDFYGRGRCAVFPSLKELILNEMCMLQEWKDFPAVVSGEKSPISYFPSLKSLRIYSCSNLQALPKELPSSLKYLGIYSCSNLQALPKELPSSLEDLWIDSCSNLQALPKELPSSLESLTIHSCDNLQALPTELPSSLEGLVINSCSNLQALPKELPSSLTYLDIDSCSNLKALPTELPSSLKYLWIYSCSNLQALPKELPSSLEGLWIDSCSNLKALPTELPSSLTWLEIHSCDNLKALPTELPSSLKRLVIDSCSNLQALPKELPSSLETLDIDSCSNLQALPKELPSSLESLQIDSWDSLEALPTELPSSLTCLEIHSCSNLKALPTELPSSLTWLEIHSCDNLKALPTELPYSLKTLKIHSCSNLQALPRELPSSLETLEIHSCDNLKALPTELPSSLKWLGILSCSNLKALPTELPSSLKRLKISSCSNLKALPKELPSSLQVLWIYSCSNLQALPKELPSSLERLTIDSCSNLQALPKELPSSLIVNIYGCPLLHH